MKSVRCITAYLLRQTPLIQRATFVLTLIFISYSVLAADAFDGRVLYNTPMVPGGPSCSSGHCHGPSPSLGQNRIYLGTTGADIAYAISAMREMGFLTGKLSATQLNDLAAYIANPVSEDAKPSVQARPKKIDIGIAPTTNDPATSFALTFHNFGSRALVFSRSRVDHPDLSIVGGSCQSRAQLVAKQSCKFLLSWRPTAPGPMQGTLEIAFDGQREPVQVSIQATALMAGSASPRYMVEFVHTSLGYYFQSSRRDEQALLDSLDSFERTGERFRVLAEPIDGASPISRFYFDQVALRGSRGGHFYTVLDSERELLIGLNPGNRSFAGLPVLEGIDSWARAPTLDGLQRTCGPELASVFRAFRGNLRFPDDPNHRYTSDFSLYARLVSEGWDGEGVSLCVPLG